MRPGGSLPLRPAAPATSPWRGRIGGTLALVLIAGASALPARAQEPEAVAASDEIVVTGVRLSELDLSRLRRAQLAFAKHRAAYAPASSLLFQLRPAAGVALDGLTLTLEGAGRSTPIAIDAGGRFALPELPAGDWRLLHNRGKGRIAVRALVFSPGASEADRPLGDLRLQCRVGWELKRSEYSFVKRSAFGVAGGCDSTRIAFFFVAPAPLEAATVAAAGGPRDLPVRADRSAYRAPLGDKALANAARVQLRLR
jgi:hypothetical protein